MPKLAALGAAAAVGAAALVGVAPAQAASVKADYTCETALGGQVVTVTVTESLPAKTKKGKEVDPTRVVMKVVLPAELVDGLRFLGVKKLSGEASRAAAKVGKVKVPLKNVGFPKTKVPASGPMTVRAAGRTTPFTMSKPGTYAVSIPRSFDFTSRDQDGNVLTDQAPCTLDRGEPTKVGTLKVTR